MAPAGGEGSYQEQSGGGRGKRGLGWQLWVFDKQYQLYRYIWALFENINIDKEMDLTKSRVEEGEVREDLG